MQTDILIEGRGLDELYQFLENKGIEPNIKYHFNHWLLSAEIAGIRLNGDKESLIEVLLDYYKGRKGKDVTLTIDNNERISFKDKEISTIRQEIVTLSQEKEILTPC